MRDANDMHPIDDIKARLEAMAGEGVPRGAAQMMWEARQQLDDVPAVARRPWQPRSARLSAAAALVMVIALIGAGGGVLSIVNRHRAAGDALGDAPRYLLPKVAPIGFVLTRTADGISTQSSPSTEAR